MRKRLRRIQKLYDTALSYVLSLDADYVLHYIVQGVGEILELDDCYIMLVDEETSQLSVHARWSSERRPDAQRPGRPRAVPLRPRDEPEQPVREAGWLGILDHLVVQSTAPMIIPDTSTFPHFPRGRRTQDAMPASVVGVPLLFREKVIGTLTAASWTRRDFEADEVVALTQLATPASLAIENARLYTSLRERLREKEILLEGNRAMAGIHEMDDILGVLAAQMARVMEDAWCGLLLKDGGRICLHAEATWDVGASLDAASRRELGEAGRGEAVGERPLQEDERPSLGETPSARRVLAERAALPLDLSLDGEPDPLVLLARRHGANAASLIPLLYQNRVLGFALVGLRAAPQPSENGPAASRDRGGFRETEYRLLQALANQAAVAIVNAQLLADERQQADDKALLLEAARLSASTLDLTGAMDDFAELAARCVDARACLIFLTGPHGRVLEFAASHGVPREEVTAFLEALSLDLERESLVHEVVDLGHSRMAVTAEMGPAERALTALLGMEAVAAWPLVSKGPCVGAVLLLFADPVDLPQQRLDLLDGVVRQAAVYVQNARLFEEVKVRAERMKAISDLTDGINSSRDLGSVFAIAARNTRNVVPDDWTGLAILERPRKIMRIPVMSFAGDDTLHPPRIYPLHNSLVLQAARTRRPVLCDDLGEVRSDMERHLYAEGMRSMLVVPLFVEGQPVAALNLASRRPAAFTADHAEILQEMAAHLATAIRNVSLFEDITRMNEELRKIDAIKSDFLSTVAHELRTPLTIIKGYLFVLLKNKRSDPFEQETLETIDAQADHLKELIENLLSLSKIESSQGVLGPHLQEIRLADIVDEVLASFRLSARKKGLDLEARVPREIVLQADRGMLARVFYNLVGNALKFTMEGRITIAARALDGHVECEVSDTGAGIAPEHVGHVFERFYHVEGPDRKAPPGTGLGLAIVQSIVAAHGGEIRVESEVGAGTTFTFTLARQPLTAG